MLKYPAKISIDKEEGGYLVSFIDFDNIFTDGETLDEAIKNAGEALNGCLESDFERGFEILDPSTIEGDNIYLISVEPNIAVAILLRKLRGAKSQIDVASELHMSYQAYQKLENPRKSNPTIKTLSKLANVFKRELDIVFVPQSKLS